MKKDLFLLLNTWMDKGVLVIELGRQNFPFFTDESTDAKWVLRITNPDGNRKPEKIKEILDSYDEGAANITIEIDRTPNKTNLKLENEFGDVFEIRCSEVNEHWEGYSLQEIWKALKYWISQYEETNDILNVYENKHANLIKFCEKEIEISKEKQNKARWVNESKKAKLEEKVEVLSHILELLQLTQKLDK